MPFPESIKLEVKRKAHYICVICNSFVPLHIHHIIPKKNGGLDTMDNAVPLCPNCHDIYGDNPQKRKWIKQRRDFWYDYCDKILNYDNLKQLEKTYNILEESMLKQDKKISNLERKIDILNNTVQQYSSLTNNLIARLPYTTEKEKDSLKEQIGISSNILAVSGITIDILSRKKKGVYYHPTGAFFRPSDSLEKIFPKDQFFRPSDSLEKIFPKDQFYRPSDSIDKMFGLKPRKKRKKD